MTTKTTARKIASPPIERVKRDAKTARKRERAARKAPPQALSCGHDPKAKVCGERCERAIIGTEHPYGCECGKCDGFGDMVEGPPSWHTVGLRLTPEELAALDAFRQKGIVPLSRAESARALIRRALGLGRGSR